MLETVESVATIVALVGGITSVLIAVLGVYREWKWSRLEKAENFLTELVEGFGNEVNALEDEYGWNMISDAKTYDQVISGMDDATRRAFDRRVRRILRRLEAMAIRIKHGLLDDAMCADYLRSIARQVRDKCAGFIDAERRSRNEPRIFVEFSLAAERWQSAR